MPSMKRCVGYTPIEILASDKTCDERCGFCCHSNGPVFCSLNIAEIGYGERLKRDETGKRYLRTNYCMRSEDR